MSTCVLTSGTTGKPKPIIHTIDNHIASAKIVCEALDFEKSDRWLLNLGAHHVAGLSILFRSAYSGGDVVFRDRSLSVVDQIKRDVISHISVVPTQLQRMVGEPKDIPVLKKLKAILIGGTSIPRQLWKECLGENLPVFASYGMTETASMVAIDAHRDPTGNFYRPLPGVEIQLGVNDCIQIKSPTLGDVFRENGFFSTEDVGKFDEQGRLQVLGRVDDMIISGGENFHPSEVENALSKNFKLQKVAVFGVSDDVFGQHPVACIHPSVCIPKLDALPKYKRPHVYYQYPSDLRDANKVCRRDLVQRHQSNKLIPIP